MHIVSMHGHGNISLHWIGLGVTWDINSHALVQHIGIAHIQASSTICGYVFLCTIFFKRIKGIYHLSHSSILFIVFMTS